MNEQVAPPHESSLVPPQADSQINSSDLGQYGEVLAAEFLKNKDYRILGFNWERKWGELDIVAVDGDQLVFVEVKTRRDDDSVKPYEAVDQKKIAKIKRAGELYRLAHENLPEAMRVDVVSITLHPKNIEHFKSVDFKS